MKTKLVTALFYGIHDFPFYGHNYSARWDRYINSLVQISKTNVPIVCYCGSNIYDSLKKHLDENNVENVELIIRELEDIKHSKEMIKIKEKFPDKFKFYLEVGWAKLALMEENYDENLDYLYWIDCGLSHLGLFPMRYNSDSDKINGRSINKFRYTFDKIFDENLFNKINNWLGDKLLDIRNTLFFHNAKDLNRVLELNHPYKSLTVGGIIGGKIEKLPKLFNRFDNYCKVCLDKEYLINHEAIMSAIGYDHPEDYKVYEFDTWYHEDTYLTMPSITHEFLSDKRMFYRFFEEINN